MDCLWPLTSGRAAGIVAMTPVLPVQLNTPLHRIAATQIRLDGAGRKYYKKRRDAGDKPSKATRALKRRLARVVYNWPRYDAPALTRDVSLGVE
jgi:transposase